MKHRRQRCRRVSIEPWRGQNVKFSRWTPVVEHQLILRKMQPDLVNGWLEMALVAL